MKYIFVKSNNTDIYWNFALEEFMLDNVKEDEFYFYVWRNTPSVLIGRNQNVYAECNLKNMENDGVKLVRRRSGGGTVYFDLGNVTYSFIAFSKHLSIDDNFKFIIDSLKKIGFITEKSGRNDILYNGKKISGNAFYNTGEKSLHHGTILLNVDMVSMSKYLNVSQKKLESKGVKSVKSRVTNLIEYSPTLTYDEIVNALYEHYCEIAGKVVEIKTQDDIKANIESHKYYNKHISKEWQMGRNQEFNQILEDRFDWGGIEFKIFVSDNKITHAKIFTDSLHPDFFDSLDDILTGVEYKAESMIDAINEGLKSKIFDSDLDKIKKDLFTLIAKSI